VKRLKKGEAFTGNGSGKGKLGKKSRFTQNVYNLHINSLFCAEGSGWKQSVAKGAERDPPFMFCEIKAAFSGVSGKVILICCNFLPAVLLYDSTKNHSDHDN